MDLSLDRKISHSTTSSLSSPSSSAESDDNSTVDPIIGMVIEIMPKSLRIADLDESECMHDFCFQKDDLQEIADLLWPKLDMFLTGDNKDRIQCANFTCPYETGLLLCLFRLKHLNRLCDLESYFRMKKTRISAILSTFMDAIFKVAQSYLCHPQILKHRFEFYSRLIQNRNGHCNGRRIWGFVDATFRRTYRPIYFQRVIYGPSRSHGIKLQSVVTPDGLIANLFGPIAGNRHDCFLLGESGLLLELRKTMPEEGSPTVALYGDGAYPQSEHLLGVYRGAPPGSNRAQWNTNMSRDRGFVVDWAFQEIVTEWVFLDFRYRMKVFHVPVAQYFMVGAFLTNLRTCCYGSPTGAYYDCPDPGTEPKGARLTLAEYLALVT